MTETSGSDFCRFVIEKKKEQASIMYNILVQNSEYNILYILVPVSSYGVESAHIMKGELSVHCKSLIVHTARKTIYSMMRSCKDTSN